MYNTCGVIIMTYEDVKIAAHEAGLDVKEKPLQSSNGRINGNKIAIRRDLPSSVHKKCVLLEEVGHYATSTGNILNQCDSDNRKQERQARGWAFDRLIGLADIVRAYERHCEDLSDMAEYLEVTEEFLLDALDFYREKYGTGVRVREYYISFEPFFTVMEVDAHEV